MRRPGLRLRRLRRARRGRRPMARMLHKSPRPCVEATSRSDTMIGRGQHSEARAHARARYGETVRYFEWDRARQAQGTEISAGGIFLRTGAPLAEGKMVTLRLALPGFPSGFTVLARVVRTVHGGVLR